MSKDPQDMITGLGCLLAARKKGSMQIGSIQIGSMLFGSMQKGSTKRKGSIWYICNIYLIFLRKLVL